MVVDTCGEYSAKESAVHCRVALLVDDVMLKYAMEHIQKHLHRRWLLMAKLRMGCTRSAVREEVSRKSWE